MKEEKKQDLVYREQRLVDGSMTHYSKCRFTKSAKNVGCSVWNAGERFENFYATRDSDDVSRMQIIVGFNRVDLTGRQMRRLYRVLKDFYDLG